MALDFPHLEYTMPPLLATPCSASLSLSPGASTGKSSSRASKCLTVCNTCVSSDKIHKKIR